MRLFCSLQAAIVLITVIGLLNVVSVSKALQSITIQEALLGHDVGCLVVENGGYPTSGSHAPRIPRGLNARW